MSRPTLSGGVAAMLKPTAGKLVLCHAPLGFGKLSALLKTQPADGFFYRLKASDASTTTLARHLATELNLPVPNDANPSRIALELAESMSRNPRCLTLFDECRLADTPSTGSFLTELVLHSSLLLRIGMRIQPLVHLQSLSLQEQLVLVGPDELRWGRAKIQTHLNNVWHRQPTTDELDFADYVLRGWPAAIELWQQGPIDDVWTPLQPFHPLHDFLHEVIRSTLPTDIQQTLEDECDLFLKPGPLHPAVPRTRTLVYELIRSRLGVVQRSDGWHPDPLFSEFVRLHRCYWTDAVAGAEGERSSQPNLPKRPMVAATVKIRAYGGLQIWIEGKPLELKKWKPASSIRLLKLLLSLREHFVTAEQGAKLLWPGYARRSAINSFHVALHGLRRRFHPELKTGTHSELVLREGHTYCLNTSMIQCDSLEVERLLGLAGNSISDEALSAIEGAVDLYTGDFLARETTEPFVLQARSEQKALILKNLHRLTDHLLTIGETTRGQKALSRLNEIA